MIKNNLEKVIVPCYCYSIEKTDEDKRSKMSKLLEFWEKNKYFSTQTFEVYELFVYLKLILFEMFLIKYI